MLANKLTKWFLAPDASRSSSKRRKVDLEDEAAPRSKSAFLRIPCDNMHCIFDFCDTATLVALGTSNKRLRTFHLPKYMRLAHVAFSAAWFCGRPESYSYSRIILAPLKSVKPTTKTTEMKPASQPCAKEPVTEDSAAAKARRESYPMRRACQVRLPSALHSVHSVRVSKKFSVAIVGQYSSRLTNRSKIWILEGGGAKRWLLFRGCVTTMFACGNMLAVGGDTSEGGRVLVLRFVDKQAGEAGKVDGGKVKDKRTAHVRSGEGGAKQTTAFSVKVACELQVSNKVTQISLFGESGVAFMTGSSHLCMWDMATRSDFCFCAHSLNVVSVWPFTDARTGVARVLMASPSELNCATIADLKKSVRVRSDEQVPNRQALALASVEDWQSEGHLNLTGEIHRLTHAAGVVFALSDGCSVRIVRWDIGKQAEAIPSPKNKNPATLRVTFEDYWCDDIRNKADAAAAKTAANYGWGKCAKLTDDFWGLIDPEPEQFPDAIEGAHTREIRPGQRFGCIVAITTAFAMIFVLTSMEELLLFDEMGVFVRRVELTEPTRLDLAVAVKVTMSVCNSTLWINADAKLFRFDFE